MAAWSRPRSASRGMSPAEFMALRKPRPAASAPAGRPLMAPRATSADWYAAWRSYLTARGVDDTATRSTLAWLYAYAARFGAEAEQAGDWGTALRVNRMRTACAVAMGDAVLARHSARVSRTIIRNRRDGHPGYAATSRALTAASQRGGAS